MRTKYKNFTPPNVRNPRARWQWWCRNIIMFHKRKMLKNSNFTIISSNCLGGMITHDLLQPQLSPTVNLFFLPDDFIRFVSNIKDYLKLEIVEAKDENLSYPVGLLGNVKIFFMHYKSFELAKRKWEDRCRRINWDNIYVIFSERDGCTYNNLLQFDSLPYKNKIVLTHKPYPEIKCSYYFQGFENEGEIGQILRFEGFFGKRKYDKWDFVSFLNK